MVRLVFGKLVLYNIIKELVFFYYSIEWALIYNFQTFKSISKIKEVGGPKIIENRNSVRNNRAHILFLLI